jgi:hypothetical protein
MEDQPGANGAEDSTRQPTTRRGSGLPQLRAALLLVVLAVLGNIILIRTGVGSVTSSRNIATLSQIFTAAMWVGTVWLGVPLAYRGIVRSRR